jgi:protein arginine N-methyltransferase 1
LKEPYFKDKYKVIKSTETGYTGHTDTWFDEAKFDKPKEGPNFDNAK